MLKKYLPTLILIIGISASGTATSSTVYTFFQGDFEEGGSVTGTFQGDDIDSNGLLDTYSSEITAFSMQFSGNSLVPALKFELADLQHLLFVLNNYPVDGYEPYGPITFPIIMHVERSLNTFTGYIVESSSRGSVFQSDLLFLEPKHSFSYEPMTITAVPLPPAIWLFGSGLLVFFRMGEKK